jgi:hypothetical protein
MSAKTPRKPPADGGPPGNSQKGESQAAVLEEMRALFDAILPADMAADWDAATTLYLETHPQMRERQQVLRAREVDKSGEVATAKRSDAAVKRSGRR